MSTEFTPSTETGSNEKGEILYDAGELKPVGHLRDAAFQQDCVDKTEVMDFGDEGFLLHKLLTPQECQYYIQRGEAIGFERIYGVRDDYRNMQRITFKSTELSDILWERIQPFLGDITITGDPHKQHIHGADFLMKGTWKPCGLNNLFRLCRYQPSGHFSPHFDGHYSRSTDERSLQTLMLYLNGDFTDGSTNFVDERQTLYKDETGKFCAEETNILCRVQPEEGMAIIFNHHRLHEGQKIGDGRKYILRTDVMYKNISQAERSDKDQRALLMVQEAERKEACGDCSEAAELYRKAFKLSPSLAEAYGS